MVKKQRFKNKYNIAFNLGAFCKLTEATIENGYLNQLILTYLHQNNPLGILEEAPEKDRPGIFLDRMGWGQQKDYIEGTLNAYLSDKLPPVVYVFTPNDSFKYRKTDSRVENEGIRSRRDEKSTFEDAVKDFMEQVGQSLSAGKESIANMFFFDKASRDNFEEVLKRKLSEKSRMFRRKRQEKKGISYSSTSQQLNVPNYGVISLYNYAVKQSLQPYK